MSRARRRKTELKSIYDVAYVPEGFRYWYYKLLNYVLGIFKWEGLPESLPWREVETNLMITGHCVFFEDKGELVTDITTLTGFDKYYRPTKAVFGNALIPFKALTFGENSEVVYNNRIQGSILRKQDVDGGLNSFLRRYARMLADIESTISIYTVNCRLQSYPTAQNQQMATALEDFNARTQIGEMAVLTDSSYLESFRNVMLTQTRTRDTLNDFLIARDKILATFFREIGVKMEQEQKKAQLTEDEVTADEQLLLIDLNDMIQERMEGIERVNKHFGTSISVSIDPAYNRASFTSRSEREEEPTNDSDSGNNI